MDTIGGVDYTSYISQANTSSKEGIIAGAKKKNATDEEMLKACKEFEQYMVEQVYKQMEKTTFKDEDEENEYMNYFNDFRIQAYAKMVTEQGKLGLADKLYESMKRNSGTDGVEE